MARQFNAENWHPDCISVRTVGGPMESDIVEVGKVTERLDPKYDGMDGSVLRAMLMSDADFLQSVCKASGILPENIANIMRVSIKAGTGLGVVVILLTADSPVPDAVLRHHAMKGLDFRVRTFRQCFSHIIGDTEVPEGYWLHEYNKTLAGIEIRASRIGAESAWQSAIRDAFTAIESVRKYGGTVPAWTKRYVRNGKGLPMDDGFIGEYRKSIEKAESRTMADFLPPAQRVTASRLSPDTVKAIAESSRRTESAIEKAMKSRIK